MKYREKTIKETQEEIHKEDFIEICRRNKNNFTRNRKVTPKDIIMYEVNKKGLTSKMEIRNFNKKMILIIKVLIECLNKEKN